MGRIPFIVVGVLVVASALGAARPARAGRSCETTRPTAATIERGLQLAQRTHEALEAAHARDGAQVVLLARAGQDLSKYGVRFSHLGLAYRTRTTQGQAAWRVLHKLNACGTATADIYRQGLGEFFLDDLWRYEAAWSVPSADAQARLLPLLTDGDRALRLHHRPYSVVSYAWGRKYQQSNQWAIETLALALDPAVTSRARAQAWLQGHGYQPAVLRLGPLTRLGGRMSAANVAFDDHPDSQRFADRIETVTADSVFAWLQRTGLGGKPVSLQ
jgi:hypothetical protein